jgi:hypothetical protein
MSQIHILAYRLPTRSFAFGMTRVPDEILVNHLGIPCEGVLDVCSADRDGGDVIEFVQSFMLYSLAWLGADQVYKRGQVKRSRDPRLLPWCGSATPSTCSVSPDLMSHEIVQTHSMAMMAGLLGKSRMALSNRS